MKVIDLFCGCGGFSLGFDYLDHDFELIYALDNWQIACDSYKANFPNVDIDCRDALKVQPSEIPKADVIIGSPPCKDFSSAKMSNRDPDLRLVNWFFSVIEHHQPEYWIMENVVHLQKFIKCWYYIFSMHEYGVPQIRRRLLAGGFNMPEKTLVPLAFPAVLASEDRWKSSYYIDSKSPRKYPRKRGIGASSAFRRLCLIPEVKLIQTFPLDFIVRGTLKEQYTQIGNAVPPFFAYHLAKALLKPKQQTFSVKAN